MKDSGTCRGKDSFIMYQANEKNTEQIMTLLTETAQWFKSKGSTQWNGLLEGFDTHHTADAIKRRDVYICKQHDAIAGMVMLLKEPSEWDRNLWANKEDEENKSIYLHRLAINREYAHENLGSKILKWCIENIQFDGKTTIRLDCLYDNVFLNGFYQQNGFTYQGANKGYALYEIELTTAQ